MKKTFKPIPNFNSENEERLFWQTHDTTEYVDWSQAEKWCLPNLKLSSQPNSDQESLQANVY